MRLWRVLNSEGREKKSEADNCKVSKGEWGRPSIKTKLLEEKDEWSFGQGENSEEAGKMSGGELLMRGSAQATSRRDEICLRIFPAYVILRCIDENLTWHSES